jgi:uncharacterized membrane protein YphA (DoxX/SURF4 family)
MKRIWLWILSAVLAVAFISAGAFKLSGAAMMVAEFTTFGYPLWFMDVTGALEIIAAVLVLIPRFRSLGAGIMACIMVGAFASHITHGQAMMTPPVIVLFALALTLGSLSGWRVPATPSAVAA